MMNYVVGFCFSEDKTHVVLIEKQHPAFMKGKLNGVGGKIEKDEDPHAAMLREFQEETGMLPSSAPMGRLWWEDAIIVSSRWTIFVFHTTATEEELKSIKTTTDEEVDIYSVDAVLTGYTESKVMPNVKLFIPLALTDNLVKPVLLHSW